MARKLRGCLRIWLFFLSLLLLQTFNSSAQLGDYEFRFIEWSPSGEYIAVVDGSKIVILSSELEIVESLHEIPFDVDSRTQYFSLSWSPDGHYLVVGLREMQDYIVVWESETWSEALQLEDQIAYEIAWSPDSQYFSSGFAIIDLQTGLPIRPPSFSPAVNIAWSPTDDIFVSGGGVNIGFYNPLTIETLTDATFSVSLEYRPVFSPDGSRLALIAGGSDYRLNIVDISTFQLERSIILPSEPTISDTLTWLSNTELAVATSGNPLQIINPTIEDTPILETKTIGVAAWSPDGTRYLGAKADSNGNILLHVSDRSTDEVFFQIAVGDSQATNHFELFDNSTSTSVVSLVSGDTINAKILTPDTVVHAKMSPEIVGSVVFDLNGQITVDNEFPFEIPIPSAGNYELTATPFTELDGGGIEGLSLTLSFSVTD